MRNRTCFHHASYSALLKYYLFLVALATVTVLRPSLANPHHGTVHTTEYCTYVTGKLEVGGCYERKDGMPIEENIIKKSNDFSLLNWFWEIITNWWSKITGYFS
ncbi:SpoV family signaling peptide [Streptococcus pyogenes]|uniref:SpoV family signaling peptide n=1 Tax=Streptococcus pyogenes TaxID=1314 RepID=UPI000DBE004F